jgi:hypothetical protein
VFLKQWKNTKNTKNTKKCKMCKMQPQWTNSALTGPKYVLFSMPPTPRFCLRKIGCFGDIHTHPPKPYPVAPGSARCMFWTCLMYMSYIILCFVMDWSDNIIKFFYNLYKIIL